MDKLKEEHKANVHNSKGAQGEVRDPHNDLKYQGRYQECLGGTNNISTNLRNRYPVEKVLMINRRDDLDVQ